MFNITRFLSYILVIALFGCEKKQEVASQYVSPKCISTQSQCQVTTDDGNFWVLFNVESIITESSFEITVKSDSKLKVVNVDAFMEGKAMFMGKIPLFFEQSVNNQEYVTEALLGSCSDDKMRWIIRFDVSLEQPDKTIIHKKFSIEFNSQRFN
jgi:hypothetical protein